MIHVVSCDTYTYMHIHIHIIYIYIYIFCSNYVYRKWNEHILPTQPHTHTRPPTHPHIHIMYIDPRYDICGQKWNKLCFSKLSISHLDVVVLLCPGDCYSWHHGYRVWATMGRERTQRRDSGKGWCGRRSGTNVLGIKLIFTLPEAYWCKLRR